MKSRLSLASRRSFLKRSLAAGATVAAPTIIPSSALGLDGAVPPSERITVGCIGIGRRGEKVLECFFQHADAQLAAVCDVKEARRTHVKGLIDKHHGTKTCSTYRDFHELLDRPDIDAVLIATGPNWHGLMAMEAAKAGKDIYCEKPCTKNIAETLVHRDTMHRCGTVFQAGTQRRNLPHFAFACELARTGRLGKVTRVYAHPGGMTPATSGWLPEEPAPSAVVDDWDMYLGPAAWRPFHARSMKDGFNFEKGGGLVGGGVLEWGSHCVDLCQWAVNDCPPPVDYAPPKDGQLVCRYDNGAELIFREKGWIPLGSCPVRFEGTDGWIETGDSAKFVVSSPALMAGRMIEEVGGYPATAHVRDFLDCVKTRGKPKGNADAACNAHLACHAANIALYLGRPLKLDLANYTFVNDEAANRLRSEARREPWHA